MTRLAARLYRLQQLDSRLDALRGRRDALRWDLENDLTVARAQEQLEAATQAWRDAEAAFRRAEAQSQRLRDKLRREEARLYSGEVTNPKELQALQQEVQSLRRRLDAADEEAVRLLLALEEADDARQAAQQALQQAQAAWESRRAQMQQELAAVEAELRDGEARRAELWAALPPEAQAQYDHLRGRKRGIAVSGMREGTCLTCGASLSSAVVQRARQAVDQLVFCPSCGRILYPLD